MDKLKKQQYHADWFQRNKAEQLAKQKARHKKTPTQSFNAILQQAKRRRNVEIDIEYLMEIYDQQEGCCALSGVSMTWAGGKTTPTSISVDRIDNEKDYVHGNVRLVCMCVNAFRNIMNDDQLLIMAQAIVSTMSSKKIVSECLIKETA